jgi:hypothetical protein
MSMKKPAAHNHGYEPQSKLWKQFRSKLRCIIPVHRQDNSTYKLQYTLFLKLGSHYPPLCEIIQLTDITALHL